MRPDGPRFLIVAAHPDDEVLGAGARLPALAPGLHLLHLTDGAPRDMADARREGFGTREEYVRARRAELEAALALAGVPPRRAREAGAVDQEASLGLAALARRAADLVAEVAPDLVLAPAYEGGHPDHDAAAFVAAAACALAAPPGCVRAEFPLYHAAADGSGPHEFLPWPGTPEVVLELDAEERALKSRLLACFTTQRGVVSTFPLDRERFRRAPPHDFTRPPHAGPLHYEGYPWGMTARRWGSLAAEALAALGLRT